VDFQSFEVDEMRGMQRSAKVIQKANERLEKKTSDNLIATS